MSIFDKIAAAVMPPETAEDRATARANAEALADEGGWLGMVIDHHRRIEAAFAQALGASDPATRTSAVKSLAVLLTAHANAEESVLYPAMADSGEKGDTAMAYQEQAMTKVEMAMLERLDPSSREWRDKLEHIQGAVLHHVYQEESSWLPRLQQELPAEQRAHVDARFTEEFQRYMGDTARSALV